jgi:hypothetical protein
MNTRGTIRAAQQQQLSANRASVVGKCSILITFINIHNYEILFYYQIVYINTLPKGEATNETYDK